MSTSLRASLLQTDNNKEKTTAKFSVHVYMYTKAIIFVCISMYLSVVSLEQNLDFLIWNLYETVHYRAEIYLLCYSN